MPNDLPSMRYPPTVVVRHPRENVRKCTIWPLRDRADGVRLRFDEAHGHVPDPAEIRTRVQTLESPQFAYTVHVSDDVRGNGDGQIQIGEIASVYMRVQRRNMPCLSLA